MEAGYSAAPTVLVEVSAADRKRNEKEMKERTTRFTLLLLLTSLLVYCSFFEVLHQVKVAPMLQMSRLKDGHF